MNASRDRFADDYRQMEDWLFSHGLPLWAQMGVDGAGGFFEKMGQDGQPIEAPRRTRVIARQIYSFCAALRIGWSGNARLVIDHGIAAFDRSCLGADGLVIATSLSDGTPVDTRYDFYDHAFALFALANAATLPEHRTWALQTAHMMQDRMEAVFRHPVVGFKEGRGEEVPLRANPHMHMLEACLALAGVDADSQRWDRLADGIVRLAIEYFIDPATGALREFFDFGWRAYSDAEGQVVEPGHQFEWAWLLSGWNRNRGDARAAGAAARLVEIACTHGIDAGGIVIDELNLDLSLRTPTARVWPQCERLKCHVEWALAAGEPVREAHWWEQASLSLRVWAPFLRTPVAGLWFDRLDADRAAVAGPAPASTLYHLVCALETAQGALKGRRADSILSLGLSRNEKAI